MDPFLAVILIGLPLAWLVGFAAYAYLDAPKYGMGPKKWAAISFFVPLFGFFAYLFERSETEYDPKEDPYAQGKRFEVHESRRGEELIDPGSDDREERRDTTEEDRKTPDERRDSTDDDDEWNDPPGVDI